MCCQKQARGLRELDRVCVPGLHDQVWGLRRESTRSTFEAFLFINEQGLAHMEHEVEAQDLAFLLRTSLWSFVEHEVQIIK